MWHSSLDTSETIYALASGAPPSAVAIIRLSGAKSFEIAEKIFHPTNEKTLSKVRGMFLGELLTSSAKPFDTPMVLSFVAPKSFTGEDVIEFHCHGSVAVVRELEKTLEHYGARRAVRGEFSYRAFINGKINGDQLELLGDVFRARESADLSGLYARRDGSLDSSIQRLRESLIRVQAVFDTAVDFSEEYSQVIQEAKKPIQLAIHECSLITRRFESFRSAPSQRRIVLAGRPNAGKSSLFNSLLSRYRAIVHHEAGTTRDVIEESIELQGRIYTLVDTAGWREASTHSEKEGIVLGEKYLSAASFWILVVDGTVGMGSEEAELLKKFDQIPHLIAWNKSDLAGYEHPSSKLKGQDLFIRTNATQAEGVLGLSEALTGQISENSLLEGPIPTEKQYANLKIVSSELEELSECLEKSEPPEFLAEMNRRLIGHLESVVGAVETDQVLERVFGDFCIGK